MTNLSFGLYFGFLVMPLPQVLAGRHVPEPAIASTTALVASPTFFMFLISPLLDVRFSRRWYASVFTIAAAALLGSSMFLMHDLLLLKIALTTGCAAIVLANAALYGWLSSVSRKEDENPLSAWLTVGIFVGAGVMAIFGAELIRDLPRAVVELTPYPSSIAPHLSGRICGAVRAESTSAERRRGLH